VEEKMNIEILKNAIKTFGVESQKLMAIEEMAELTKELSKDSRGFSNQSEIAEEIADVEIMLAQLKLIFNNSDTVEEFKESKMKRLQKKIEEKNLQPCYVINEILDEDTGEISELYVLSKERRFIPMEEATRNNIRIFSCENPAQATADELTEDDSFSGSFYSVKFLKDFEKEKESWKQRETF
jgi:NTP pyrophosphatase (non-canonical NTP hydrolase)